MYCRNCGNQVNGGYEFCPYCGNKIVETVQNNNVNMNVNEPSNSIGFNRNLDDDLNNFGFNNPYEMRNPTKQMNQNVNNIPTGMRMKINNKKKIPWFSVALVLLIIMVGGIIFFPKVNENKMNTYNDDVYSIEYNSNWSQKNDEENLFLYYSDNLSKFLFNASLSFKDLGVGLNNESDKKTLYNAFYVVWKDVDDIELTGGSGTFLTLNNGDYYAKVDYKMKDGKGIGSFYVVINIENDLVLTFMSYSSLSNKSIIEEETLKMLNSISYSK